MGNIDVENIMQWGEGIFKFLEGYVPKEILGFGAICLAFVAVAISARTFFRNDGHDEKDEKGIIRYSPKKSRKIAEGFGFLVEEVERDVPEFRKTANYVLTRVKCRRYQWPQMLGGRVKWSLLNRPGETARGVQPAGWHLDGVPPPEHMQAIDFITQAIGEPRAPYEIECDGGIISFYWTEKGVDDGVALMNAFISLLRK